MGSNWSSPGGSFLPYMAKTLSEYRRLGQHLFGPYPTSFHTSIALRYLSSLRSLMIMLHWWIRCSLIGRILVKAVQSGAGRFPGHLSRVCRFQRAWYGGWVGCRWTPSWCPGTCNQANHSVTPGNGFTAVEYHKFVSFKWNAVIGRPAPLSEHLHTDQLLYTRKADDIHFSKGASTKADWATSTKIVALPRDGQKGQHTWYSLITVTMCVGWYGLVRKHRWRYDGWLGMQTHLQRWARVHPLEVAGANNLWFIAVKLAGGRCWGHVSPVGCRGGRFHQHVCKGIKI